MSVYIVKRSLVRAFAAYWSPKAIAARMDDWTHAVREATGSKPDPKVEQRIAERKRG